MKTCTLCSKTKPLSEFTKHRAMKDGRSCWCKSCSNKRAKAYRESPAGIYTTIKGRENFRKRKPFNITKEGFLEWYAKQLKNCVYCGISQEDAPLMRKHYNAHATRLSIDCKDNDKGYVLENMVLSCGRCNFIKGNMFTYDEMREIGEKYIKPKWQAFKKIGV